jgi:hypothetical protein
MSEQSVSVAKSDMYGKGLDVGTSRLVAAWKESDKDVVVSLRDCYFELKDDDIDFIQKQGDWKLTTINGRSFALADDGLTVANWVKQEVKRPMSKGVLNPTDDDAVDILEELIGKILGAPRYPGEICVCSIPANTADGEIDTTPHVGAVKQIITKLGYTFQQINEGYATLLALNPKVEKDGETMPFTGIGISFGGGMVNLSLAYKMKELKKMQTSTSHSGDFIDSMVAKSFGKDPGTNSWRVKSNQVTKFKEEYFEFGKKYTDEELNKLNYKTPERKKYFNKMMTNLELYYENMMEYTVAAFKEKFEESDQSIEEALEIVISGGTSTPKGFETKFKEILNNSEFPIAVKNVRKADNTLNSTVTGALLWAINLEQKKKNNAT